MSRRRINSGTPMRTCWCDSREADSATSGPMRTFARSAPVSDSFRNRLMPACSASCALGPDSTVGLLRANLMKIYGVQSAGKWHNAAQSRRRRGDVARQRGRPQPCEAIPQDACDRPSNRPVGAPAQQVPRWNSYAPLELERRSRSAAVVYASVERSLRRTATTGPTVVTARDTRRLERLTRSTPFSTSNRQKMLYEGIK